MPKKTTQNSTNIESVRHKDKRANIPTEELRDFISDEQKTPKKILYPRDESLDPQLVWKGKDEQDSKELEVPAVPIYIQEKIHPQAIIEDFRTQAKKEQAEQQLSLFGDFNGLEFEKLIDFYQHKDGVKWANRMILGDSLLVMNSLVEKEGLKGKVQMIYIDPPYGIKFGSNWQVSTRKRDVKDGKAEEVTRQPEQVKAFRDTWEKGIHSYLAYLRDRLLVAQELLTETGSIFVQIGDENVHLVRCLLDEVFGSENFISMLSFAKTSGLEAVSRVASRVDFLLWYAKDSKQIKYRELFTEKSLDSVSGYTHVELPDGLRRRLTSEEVDNLALLPRGSRVFTPDNLTKPGPGSRFQVRFEGRSFEPGNRWWGTTPESMDKLIEQNRLIVIGNSLRYVRYLDDFSYAGISNLWLDTGIAGFKADKRYVVETNPKVIERCLLMTTDPGDLVLDTTGGSGSTAYVAEQWGRRWISIDTSRVALALARTRLMSAKYPYYLLADSPEGIQKEAEITGQLPSTKLQTEYDIRKGFVYKRVPHVTLKAIANNPEIDTIHAKWQQQLEPIRTQLNQLLKKSWEEWEIPREPQEKWSQQAKDLLTQWWELRQQPDGKLISQLLVRLILKSSTINPTTIISASVSLARSQSKVSHPTASYLLTKNVPLLKLKGSSKPLTSLK